MIVIQKFSQRQLRNDCCCSSERQLKQQDGSPSHIVAKNNSSSKCDNNSTRTIYNSTHLKQQQQGAKRLEAVIPIRLINLQLSLHLSLLLLAVVCQAEPSPPAQLNRQPTEYQLVGQVNQEAHLPCLIGKQLYCGEPYFIAWYKLNGSTKSWVRIEHSKSSEPDGVELTGSGGNDNYESNTNQQQQHQQHHLSSAATSGGHQYHRPVNERVQFSWTRSQQQQQQRSPLSSWRPACDQLQLTGAPNGGRHGKLEANFDCAQLTIGRLELMDEGQYKCEITFSESLDFDKCPATTLSQLNVIAHPNEPELLINGRPQQQQQQQSAPITFKEGAQVKLDCLSSGGRPAPRIEWLNVSLSIKQQDNPDGNGNGNENGLSSPLADQQQPEVQLMRSHWPQKKSTYVESMSGTASASGYNQQQQQQQQQTSLPITSSSVTISLTRHDLNSHFVCLVLPHTSSASANLEQLIRSPVYLAALLASGPAAAANGKQQRRPISTIQPAQNGGPMFKWIKLDVSVKPTSVGLVVRDLEADEPLEPIMSHRSQQQQQPTIAIENYLAPYYSLKPNRLYAVQCIVENSRPQSQIAWFNRTAPIGFEARQLNGSVDFIRPAGLDDGRRHRLSSFIRSIGHSNGTFRSIATLLITTNVWDNFEELFCRISNEAFQLDELLQVAPIISARLYVNYAPFAWLETANPMAGDQLPVPPDLEDNKSGDLSGGGEENGTGSQLKAITIIPLSRQSGSDLTLRCSVAANPLSQNTILQIEWLKDGRKLAANGLSGGKSQQQQQQSRIYIEKANHLHMPATVVASQLQLNLDLTTNHQNTNNNIKNFENAGLGNQLVASSKLIGSSLLTISSLSRASDSGLYSCHYKLIPAPSAQLNGGAGSGSSLSKANLNQQQQQQQIRITSGQANQTIQVNVIDAKPRAPTLMISSSKALLIYGPQVRSVPSNGPAGRPRSLAGGGSGGQLEHLTVIGQPGATISLRCHLPKATTGLQQQQQLSNQQKALAAAVGLFPHKIMWHLNGALIHSSGLQETSYNFTLAKTQLAGSSEQHQHGVGLFSCSHHVLVSGSSPDNFHGSQMRVFQSANQIELRIRVGPKLVVPAGLKRSELMPPLRSFSELELNANSGNKLRLVCMAQCEPICSIDWYLNGRLLGPTAAINKPPKSKWMQLQIQELEQQQQQHLAATNATPLTSGGAATATQQLPVWLTRTLEMEQPLDEELGLGLVQIESLIHGSFGGADGSWVRAASLAPAGGRTDSFTEFGQLRQEIVGIQQQQQQHTLANVFSKLELTYGQLASLLLSRANDNDNNRQVIIKCKLNPMLNGQRAIPTNRDLAPGDGAAMGHALVEPGRWFPADDLIEMGSVMDFMDESPKIPFFLSNEPLNLTQTYPMEWGADSSILANSVEEDLQFNWSSKDNNNNNIDSKPIDLHARKLLSLGQQQQQKQRQPNDLPLDEMQIRLLLDRPPRGVSVSFAGLVSSDLEPSGVKIIEGQLIELMDPGKPAPMLECQVTADSATYPKPQFKWTFTDSNGSEHALPSNGPQFDLRKFIEFRQNQLNVDPMSAYGAEVVASFVGNYTCTASNIHGSKSATLPIQIQGRPLCKLTLGNEYLGPDHELLANLRCLIYSNPHLLETVWFRGSQQLAVNKTSAPPDTIGPNALIRMVQFPIVVLNKQQDFMLMDNHHLLANQLANFKCIARNSLGYSEACELSKADKLTLINTFKPIQGGLSVVKQPPIAAVQSITNPLFSIIKKQQQINENPHLILTNQTSFPIDQATNNSHEQHEPIVKLERNFWSFLMITCILAIALWLMILLVRCLVGRCYSSSLNLHDSRKLHQQPTTKKNHNTSWRFRPTSGSNLSSMSQNNETMGNGRLPFQSKTICVNYYCGSNGDSEHDMMQSCSQSSHYEEFAATATNNNHHQMMHHHHHHQQLPPVYFNTNHVNGNGNGISTAAATTTLSRRTLLKPSLSTSSTGDSGGSSSAGGTTTNSGSRPSASGSGGSGSRQLMRDKSFTGSSSNGTTMLNESHHHHPYGTNNNNRYGGSTNHQMSLTSNVPLISGANVNSSRINLHHQQVPTTTTTTLGGGQQNYGRFQRGKLDQQQTFGHPRSEPIYDDVIYNQMIL